MSRTVVSFEARRGPMLRVAIARAGFGAVHACIDDPHPPARPDVQPSLRLELPKIPWDARECGYIQIWRYFHAVYAKQRSEAFIWLHWRAPTATAPGAYVMVVPSFYTATAGGLRYPSAPERFCAVCQVAMFDAADHCPHCGPEAGRPTACCFVGDAHSHGVLQPYHSGTDDHDELDGTGIRLTFGLLHEGPTRVAHSFVVADGPTRFVTDWEDHFGCAADAAANDRTELWLRLVATSDVAAAVFRKTGGDAVYTGMRGECELWIASRRDGAAFEVRQRVEAPAAPRRDVAPVVAPPPRTLSVVRPKARPPAPPNPQALQAALAELPALLQRAPASAAAHLLHLLCYDLTADAGNDSEVEIDELLGVLPLDLVDHLRTVHKDWLAEVERSCAAFKDEEQLRRAGVGPLLVAAMRPLQVWSETALDALLELIVADNRDDPANDDFYRHW